MTAEGTYEEAIADRIVDIMRAAGAVVTVVE